jgi:hypothetical protein
MKATIEVDGVITNIIEIPDGASYEDYGAREYVSDDAIAQPVMDKRYEHIRRVERDEVFTSTLDILNPLWYASLSTSQQDNLAVWRQQWLDYPSTGVIPDNILIQDIF